MATALDAEWASAMLALIDSTSGGGGGTSTAPNLSLGTNAGPENHSDAPAQPPTADSFHDKAQKYITYLRIYTQLEQVYDQITHPQKRKDVRKALDATIGRFLELKEELAHDRPGKVFVNLDEVLVDLKLTPDKLEIPVPRFATEDHKAKIQDRNKLIDAIRSRQEMSNQNSASRLDEARSVAMTLEAAIRCCQANERGRQGQARAKAMLEIRFKEQRERAWKDVRDKKMDAAENVERIQRYYRGWAARALVQRLREEEYIFLGMKPPPPLPPDKDPHLKLIETRELRRQRQVQHEEAYQSAL